MLSAGDEDYYLAVGSAGPVRHDEYYSQDGDSPGVWVGGGSPALGLAGRVEGRALRAVLAGVDPSTGADLVSSLAGRRRRPGMFLTFSAPKGVSLIGALGDPAVGRAIDAAHARAVADALGYLDDNAVFARRGHDGLERIGTGGLVAAGFVHRTSRAGDPQLHTHVLAANLVQGADGRWSALDSRSLFAHARTAGFVYQAALRDRLTRSLGLGWSPVRAGMAEPAGIARGVLREFSTRRRDIEEHLAAVGESGAKAAQVAAYRSRTAKDHDVDAGVLVESWRLRADDLGLSPEKVAALTGPGRTPEPLDVDGLVERLAGPAGLTAQRTTFARRDVIRAVAEAAGDGAARTAVEQTADRVLADERILVVGPTATGSGADRPAGAGESRYTTVDLVAAERRVLAGVERRRASGAGLVPAALQQKVLADLPSLSDEQAAAIERLLGDGDGVAVVVGRAGTGKTFALDACRSGWQTAGLRVIGAAPSARAAAELQAGAGIPSTTLARLLLDAERPFDAGGGLPRGGVVVVDEAGMAGTRTLDRLLKVAERDGTQVVLVGDPAQLPEIEAGGVLRAVAERLDAPELRDNRRQVDAWERDALDRLRAGQSARAVAVYRDHGRLVMADSAADARQALVADWWAAREDGAEVGMYALRRADVDGLNRLARAVQAETGRLGPVGLQAAGRVFAVGDEIVALRNDRRFGLVNGTRATVTAIDLASTSIEVRTAGGDSVHIPGGYLVAGHVDLGYALTLHKAQGATVDRAFLLGSDQLYREAGYVGMSRGRAGNDLYLVAGDDGAEIEAHTRPPARGQDGAIRTLVESLGRSHAQQVATAAGIAGPLRDVEMEHSALMRRAAFADPGPHLAPLGPPPAGGLGRLRWGDAAQAIDTYRARYQVTDPASLLGPVPLPGRRRDDFDDAAAPVRVAAVELALPDPFLPDPAADLASVRQVEAGRGRGSDDRGWSR
ncbi:MAG: relaxase domain-containing protein [Actinomycetota bacterium]|nr:relaxase domain-containing protein [Actinomycetota bacterium]